MKINDIWTKIILISWPEFATVRQRQEVWNTKLKLSNHFSWRHHMSRGHLIWCCSSTSSEQLFLLTHKKKMSAVSTAFPVPPLIRGSQHQCARLSKLDVNDCHLRRALLQLAPLYFSSLQDAICHMTNTVTPSPGTRPDRLPCQIGWTSRTIRW